MDQGVLKNCLALAATVKELDKSPLALRLWQQQLSGLSNALGERAFNKCFGEKQYGKFSPAHVLAAAEELQAQQLAIGAGGSSWISAAPKFNGHRDYRNPSREWREWLEAERPRRYRSLDRDGKVWLVQNPDAWEWHFDLSGELLFQRPTPLPTDETVKPQRQYRREAS